MNVLTTGLPGVLVIEPKIFGDDRGFFLEIFHASRYAEHGLPPNFVQDNLSRSAKGTLRGLHLQEPRAQGKLVQVLSGAIWDVAVDVRRGSPHFGRFVGVELDSTSRRQLWVPPGFAHGFCVLSDSADVLYKCTELYAPECERGIAWNDPDLNIPWPLGGTPLLSAKDAAAPRLRDAPILPSYRR